MATFPNTRGLDLGLNPERIEQLRRQVASFSPPRFPGAGGNPGGRTDEATALLAQLRGDIDPQQFRGIFARGAERIDQPGEQQAGFEGFLKSGVEELTEAFVDRFVERTGNLPDASQVEQFVGQNLTPTFASKFITGQTPRVQIKTNLVDPFIDEKGIGQETGIGEASERTQQRLSEILGTLRGQVPGDVQRAFAPARRRAVEEESIRGGRLRSPITRSQLSPVSDVEAREGQAISDVLRGLTTQELSGELDLFKFGESLGEAERRAGDAQRMFGLQHRFDRERFDEETRLRDKELKLSKLLGRLQAGKKGRSGLMSTLTGVGTGVATGAAVGGPIGAGVGAGVGLLGGLASQFG